MREILCEWYDPCLEKVYRRVAFSEDSLLVMVLVAK
jgi:hypothetical protein